MNRKTDASGNSVISAERRLPWIQDTEEADVWTQWNVTYRDVFIVDGAGELAGVYNLTSNDLSVPDNLLSLQQLIMASAVLPDTDADKLSDLWEQATFGNLTTANSTNADQFVAYALGSSPTARSPHFKLRIKRELQIQYAQIEFDARLGAAGGLTYSMEVSESGIEWSPLEVIYDASAPPVPHYNGTAMQTYTFRTQTLTQPAGLIRVRAGFPLQ
ncbi:MAG: hypothetical protein ACI9R3_000742 [Verrucomicrobiales bacterium]